MPGATAWKYAFFAASAALVVSIAVNVRSALEPPPPAPRCPPCPELHCPPAPACAAIPAPSGAPEASCVAELAKCREEAWAVVARAMRAPPPAPRPVASVEGDAGAAGQAGAPGTTPADQRRAFCDLAERQVRDQVLANKEAILGSLSQVGTRDFVANELPATLERVKGALSLSDEQVDKLAPQYARLWRSHGDDLHTALSSQPFDDEAATRAVHAFWEDEDRMISTMLGGSALDSYRSSQLYGRTAFLTIFASLGGKPFDAVASW